MRLIDADAFCERLRSSVNGSAVRLTFYCDVRYLLAKEPTIDPVKHAYWIPNTDDFTPAKRCSCCGYNKPEIAVCGGMTVHNAKMNEAQKTLGSREPENYCPNCGATMSADNETEKEK